MPRNSMLFRGLLQVFSVCMAADIAAISVLSTEYKSQWGGGEEVLLCSLLSTALVGYVSLDLCICIPYLMRNAVLTGKIICSSCCVTPTHK